MTSVFLKRPEVTASVTPVDRARVVEEFTRDTALPGPLRLGEQLGERSAADYGVLMFAQHSPRLFQPVADAFGRRPHHGPGYRRRHAQVSGGLAHRMQPVVRGVACSHHLEQQPSRRPDVHQQFGAGRALGQRSECRVIDEQLEPAANGQPAGRSSATSAGRYAVPPGCAGPR